MASLILLNGPPGIGKSTLARRYVAEHPLALCLDVDAVRGLLGRWEDHPEQAGLLARAMSLQMARSHLAAGHDVIVPQFLARTTFIDQLHALADQVGVRFVELVLLDADNNSQQRFAARALDPALAAHHHTSERLIGGADGLAEASARLARMIKARPAAVVIRTRLDETSEAYQKLCHAVAAATGG